jgi:hypothetical protein
MKYGEDRTRQCKQVTNSKIPTQPVADKDKDEYKVELYKTIV